MSCDCYYEMLAKLRVTTIKCFLDDDRFSYDRKMLIRKLWSENNIGVAVLIIMATREEYYKEIKLTFEE